MVQVDVAGLGADGVPNKDALAAAMAKARAMGKLGAEESFMSKYKWYLLGGAALVGGFFLFKK